MMSAVLLQVAYDGTRYAGFVPQTNANTVADELLRAVRSIDPGASILRGTSRTDAGVHAEAQYVAFDTDKTIPPKGWALGLNHVLPNDIAVRSAQYVPTGFSPRFNNRGKRYAYHLFLDRLRHPLRGDRAWHLHDAISIDRLEAEMNLVLGEHDFTAFCNKADTRADRVRTMRAIDCTRTEDARVILAIEGDGFLYNMVRILVGTWVDVGRGRLREGATLRAFESKRREDLGVTAPAHGLVLERIDLVLPGVDSNLASVLSESNSSVAANGGTNGQTVAYGIWPPQ